MEPNANDLVVLLEGHLPDLKTARDALTSEGLTAEILRPPGCKTSS